MIRFFIAFFIFFSFLLDNVFATDETNINSLINKLYNFEKNIAIENGFLKPKFLWYQTMYSCGGNSRSGTASVGSISLSIVNDDIISISGLPISMGEIDSISQSVKKTISKSISISTPLSGERKNETTNPVKKGISNSKTFSSDESKSFGKSISIDNLVQFINWLKDRKYFFQSNNSKVRMFCAVEMIMNLYTTKPEKIYELIEIFKISKEREQIRKIPYKNMDLTPENAKILTAKLYDIIEIPDDLIDDLLIHTFIGFYQNKNKEQMMKSLQDTTTQLIFDMRKLYTEIDKKSTEIQDNKITFVKYLIANNLISNQEQNIEKTIFKTYRNIDNYRQYQSDFEKHKINFEKLKNIKKIFITIGFFAFFVIVVILFIKIKNNYFPE